MPGIDVPASVLAHLAPPIPITSSGKFHGPNPIHRSCNLLVLLGANCIVWSSSVHTKCSTQCSTQEIGGGCWNWITANVPHIYPHVPHIPGWAGNKKGAPKCPRSVANR